jgi:hypothetical protein
MHPDKVQWLTTMTVPRRTHFFACLSHELTIVMRLLCRSEEESLIERIDRLNEVHHAICGYLVRVCTGSESNEWLKVVVGIFFSSPDKLLSSYLENAWMSAERSIS